MDALCEAGGYFFMDQRGKGIYRRKARLRLVRYFLERKAITLTHFIFPNSSLPSTFVYRIFANFALSYKTIMKQSSNIRHGHYTALLNLGVPIIIGQIGTIVLNFADTLMIGHHSTVELAAASFINTLLVLVIIFALGFSYGLTPVVGNLVGRGETGKIGGVMRTAMAANTMLAALMLAVVAALYVCLDRLGQPEELIPLMRPYLLVNIISLPFVCWQNTFKQFYDAIGDTTTPMYVLIGGNVLNISGNYMLIYGALGFPEMGLLGAGISTMASRIIMCAVFAVLFFRARGVPPSQRSRMAHSVADGHGDCRFLADCHLRGVDGHGVSRRPPDHAHRISTVLHGILRSCRRRVGACQLFPRAGRHAGHQSHRVGRFSYDFACGFGGGGSDFSSARHGEPVVQRQCRSVPAGIPYHYPAHTISVWRRFAVYLCQRPSRHVVRAADDVCRLLLLFRGLPASQLVARYPYGLWSCGIVVCLSCVSHLCGSAVLFDIPQGSARDRGLIIHCTLLEKIIIRLY